MAGSVLFLVPYPQKVAPSQRFRVELYEPVLKENNVRYEIKSFMDDDTWKIIFKSGHYFSKLSGILKGYLRRFGHVMQARKFDYVFIHRETSPLGPPIFEWILAKVMGKKIIYDFDDAIWIPNISKANKAVRWVKAFWKVKHICRWSHMVTAGNDYLKQFAGNYTSNVILLPTCVDVERKHNKVKTYENTTLVIGWTGSHSTTFYLNNIVPVIKELQALNDFRFVVIADKKPELSLDNWEFVQWNEATETEDLLKIDIGIMPLKPDAWSEGKCGFKLIQYMSCGIPAIADPIGVNKTIIDHGKNGFLCNTKAEWKEKLQLLLNDASLRVEFGRHGRQKIVNEYSIQSQTEKFMGLFR